MSSAADRVWVLRHGESTANVEGLIVSVPGPRALTEVGLTAHGRDQARQAAREGLAQGLGPRTVVVSSDFARALQTAEEFAAGLDAAPPRVDERLRERSFGRYDEGPASAYQQIWRVDRDRGTHEDGVEQVAAVAARVCGVLEDADELAREAPVVLVAHGDVLQIALAVGAGRDPHEHREVPHLANAELRPLGEGRGADSAGSAGGTAAAR
ncbi:MAG TPA: histidine phosphatase family protein [Brachybacterium sp.]|nr:histidine phosphatase family protein [Brachybacterium sp.]